MSTRNPLLDHALEAASADNISLAEKLFRDCLEQDGENAEAIRELGLIEYSFHKNSEKAKELVEKSLQLDDCVMGHFYLALILDNLRIYPGAEEEFEYSIRESNGGWNVVMNTMYGDVLVARGRLAKAKLHFMAALEKEPDYEPAQKSYAKLLELLESE